MDIKRSFVIGGLITGSLFLLFLIIAFSLYFLLSGRAPLVTPKLETPSLKEKDLLQKAPGEEYAPSVGEEGAQKLNVSKRLLIESKTLTLEVKNIYKAWQKIDEIVFNYEGDITNADISSKKATITLRIPTNKFSEAEKKIKKLGKVKSEKKKAEDVTQQHINLGARIRNLEKEEERYLEFFKAAKTLDEMLKVESEISRVRGEIESLQAQKAHLEESASLANLTINLYKKGKVPGYDWGFVKAVIQAIRDFVAVINTLIIALGTLLPFILIIGGAIGLLLIWIRRQPSK